VTAVLELAAEFDGIAADLEPFRCLVTGSRTWSDKTAVARALGEVLGEHAPLIVVHGDATGADHLAHCWVRAMARYGHPVSEERHPADWAAHGRSAGHIRNAEMVKAGAHLVVAFVDSCTLPGCAGRPRHDSHGTSHCLGAARAAGIEIRRIEAATHA
jgi:hypothetical protein